MQATFASAYRALRADTRPVALRAWLFTIARNECLSILRRRRPTVELNGEPALTGDPCASTRASRGDPPHARGPARTAGAPARGAGPGRAARTQPGRNRRRAGRPRRSGQGVHLPGSIEPDLRAARRARSTAGRSAKSSRRPAAPRCCRAACAATCAPARAAAPTRTASHASAASSAPCCRWRRRSCSSTASSRTSSASAPPTRRTYAGGAAVGGSVAGAAAEIAGGGVKALAVKVAAGVAVLGASAGVGVSVLSAPRPPHEPTTPASIAARDARLKLLASAGPERHVGQRRIKAGADRGPACRRHSRGSGRAGQPAVLLARRTGRTDGQ